MVFTLIRKHLDIRNQDLEKSKITINEFLKQMKKTFGQFEYKATSKDGRVFKSIGFDKTNKHLTK